MKKLLILIQALALALVLGMTAFAAEVSTKGLTVTPGNDSPGTIWTDKSEYIVGERVNISFKTDSDGYVAVYDVTADGTTKIWPRNGSQWCTAGRVYNLSDWNSFTAAPPYGSETLVLVVSKNRRSIDNDFGAAFRTKGLSIGVTPGGAWATATCGFTIIPAHVPPTLMVTADDSVILYLDGREIGRGSSSTPVSNGEHQLVAIRPGMRVFVHDFRVTDRSGVMNVTVENNRLR